MRTGGRDTERSEAVAPRDLLQPGRRSGYPQEYLLARIRGRRSSLVREWRALLAGTPPAEFLASPLYHGFVRERSLDGLWRSLQREYRWVFGQMDEAMREALAPYFLYAELRTIMVCLRLLQGEKAQQIGEILAESLLGDEVKAVLAAGDPAAAAAGLEAALVPLSRSFAGLAAVYREEGLRGLEQQIASRCLAAIRERPLLPALREFFAMIIDARNIMALYKSIAFGAKDGPRFLDGGTIAPDRLRDLQARGDLPAVKSLVRQASGILIAEPGPTQVEVALYRGITRALRREGRDPLGTAVILEYLWRCSLEVTNLSVLFAGKDLERDALAAELVA